MTSNEGAQFAFLVTVEHRDQETLDDDCFSLSGTEIRRGLELQLAAINFKMKLFAAVGRPYGLALANGEPLGMTLAARASKSGEKAHEGRNRLLGVRRGQGRSRHLSRMWLVRLHLGSL